MPINASIVSREYLNITRNLYKEENKMDGIKQRRSCLLYTSTQEEFEEKKKQILDAL